MWAVALDGRVLRSVLVGAASVAVSVSGIGGVKVGGVGGIVVERRGRREVVERSGVERTGAGPGEKEGSLRGGAGTGEGGYVCWVGIGGGGWV